MDNYSFESFKYSLINQINRYRSNHGVKNLKNDSAIDNIAQQFANQLAYNGELNFSYNQYKGEDLGESVYESYGYLEPTTLAKTLYDENKEYNYKDEDPEPSNFTQMVWKNSELIGFGMQANSWGQYFYVINYYPTGNVDTKFTENVFPPGTKASDILINKKNSNKKGLYEKDGVYTDYSGKIVTIYAFDKKRKEKNNKDDYKKKSSYPSSQLNSDYNEFCLEALDAHNKYRRIHHVEPLKLNKDLCRIAENYSRKIAQLGYLQHSDNCYKGNPLGENLFYCYGQEATGNFASKDWYDENENYNYYGDWKSGTGHFTQMVWKGTKEVGFGKYKDNEGKTYVVANYYPAGNTIGQFKKNVFRP